MGFVKGMVAENVFVTGGAGFIGSHLVSHLLDAGKTVTVFDNFSNGKLWHLAEQAKSEQLRIIDCDLRDVLKLNESMAGHDTVFHLASNADIARAANDPDIDFDHGTFLTKCVLEAMRKNGVSSIVFTSGSGVYGEVPDALIKEDHSPLIPVSTYGAQKLASEALISAYSFMFDMRGVVFRFANVVGGRQTHGVAYDFLLKLANNPEKLSILGDGTQTKPYIHVEDVISAFDIITQHDLARSPGFSYFNVASNDTLTVRDIADLTCLELGLDNVRYEFSGGSRGWKADVPKYKLDTSKIRQHGWSNKFNSREAVCAALRSMIKDISDGKIGEN